MKFVLETFINKPRQEVWNAFGNIENMPKWQPTLIKHEVLSGVPGQPGSVSELIYKDGEQEFSLTETIIHHDEPNDLESAYENRFAVNVVKNNFMEQGKDQTLWIVENEFKFKTLFMKIMGNVLKKNYVRRTQRDMARFKEMLESL